MMQKNRLTSIFVAIAIAFSSCHQETPYLSSLTAGKDFPLYATYAAAMERSGFVLDQGYEFRYYNDSLGADFITDTGGDIGIGFKMNGKWVYRISDMHNPPVIKTSYPDMVIYEFEPFKDIKVTSTFLVYSSLSALVDLSMKNSGSENTRIEIFPFMRSNDRSFHSIVPGSNQQSFQFSHEEYPDNWTLSHQLPYTDSIINLFMMSTQADDIDFFSSEDGESPMMPSNVFIDSKATLQLNGRMYDDDGQRLVYKSPVNRLQLIVNDNYDVMLTDNTPVWGTTQAVFENNGYFRMEGGLIDPHARSYRLTGYNEILEKSGSQDGIFSKPSERVDLKLTENGIPVVSSLKYAEKSLIWNAAGEDISYSVYRREYPDNVYRRIAHRIKENQFADHTVSEDKIYGYVVTCHNSSGIMGMHSRETTSIPLSDFNSYVNKDLKPDEVPAYAKILSFRKELNIPAGKVSGLRFARTAGHKDTPGDSLLAKTLPLFELKLSDFKDANEKLFSNLEVPEFKNMEQEALFWSTCNMMRQVFYPPEAKSSYNYYVFSREPTWGWGHGGQVFHESITMLAYAEIDKESAMNSQRVYSERQYPNGYINYRTGSYLDEIIEYNGELTSSAPWYAYLNNEIYKITKDKGFLKEMYYSSKKFYEFYVSNRDKDNDGLCEWGGHAVLESVRDALVAVWDEVGWPANFEALDLNCMLVMEAKALESMARELGLDDEADLWRKDHLSRTNLINSTFWDEETGFYYNVNIDDHSFTFKNSNDLKRQEIIGFLPLWAGVADMKKAALLVEHLTDAAKFWRPYGIPSLSASDSYYNDKGYWNGPVWVQWNYLVMKGLLDYGYTNEAGTLVKRVTEVMIDRLRKDHNLWEFYSPDDLWGGHHKTYIWAGIINRMMQDVSPFR